MKKQQRLCSTSAKDLIHLSWRGAAHRQRDGWPSRSSPGSMVPRWIPPAEPRVALSMVSGWAQGVSPSTCVWEVLAKGWHWPEKWLQSPPDDRHPVLIIHHFGLCLWGLLQVISLRDSRPRSGKVYKRVVTNNSISLGVRDWSIEILCLSVNNHASVSLSSFTVKMPIIRTFTSVKGQMASPSSRVCHCECLVIHLFPKSGLLNVFPELT